MSTTDLTLNALKSGLAAWYVPAIRAHLDYEVFTGKRNKKAIQEFEAALSHLATVVLTNDASELKDFKSHCERVSIETTEYVAECYLKTLRARIDPYYKHPCMARFFLLARPAVVSENYAGVKEIQNLVASGRKLKGHDHSRTKSLSYFKEAVRKAEELDKIIPFCPFGDRLFAVVLSLVMLVIGLFMGRLFT